MVRYATNEPAGADSVDAHVLVHAAAVEINFAEQVNMSCVRFYSNFNVASRTCLAHVERSIFVNLKGFEKNSANVICRL